MIATTTQTRSSYPALTDRWLCRKCYGEGCQHCGHTGTLKPHKGQKRFMKCRRQRILVPSGRGSGKTECAKRKLVLEAYGEPNGIFVASAPTFQQAKNIFWRDLKALVSPSHVVSVSESELTIELRNLTRIIVTGMDRPERVEGFSYISGILFDEYGNMRSEAWQEHMLPAITRYGNSGWAWFIGVPEGRNHYWELYNEALESQRRDERLWGVFHWPSADILNPADVERARRELDERTFRQEFEGSFEEFAGRAYVFEREVHAGRADVTQYDSKRDLIFCFDFNKAPGVAAVLQEKPEGTAVIGEIWRRDNSRTDLICGDLVAKWRHHTGLVKCYGDATGGAGGTSSVRGSDWEIIRSCLKASDAFGDRCRILHKRSNPRIAVRVNAVNARLRDASGQVRFWVDPLAAPHVIQDLEGVTWDILQSKAEQDRNPTLGHISAAIGYYCEQLFGLASKVIAA